MRITKMVVDSKDNKKVHIYTDDTYFMVVDVEIVYKLHLKVNKELDLEILDSLNQEQNLCQSFNRAVNLISRNLKTKKQIKDYLYKNGYDKQTIQLCVEKLENIGLINDDMYCKKYIEQEKNKKGKNMLSYMLQSKGIDKNIIAKNLENLTTQKDAICNIKEKYMRNKPHDVKNLQKLKRYLFSKGFSFEEINACIGEDDESWN